MGQLSFFSAEARQPCVGDLAGVLCGPGQVLGFARGRAARVSVGLEERWRAPALVAAFAERGVQAEARSVEAPPPEDGAEDAEGDAAGNAGPVRTWEVRTAFRADLRGLAARWLRGAEKAVPEGFTPHGGVLRMWALASGRWVESGYLLGLDPLAPATHEPLRTALAAAGLPAALLTPRAGPPALRVVGRRRLERLAELVGRAPRGVAERTWPAA
ncbi:hypothetical protein [Saccharothrix coeruleofusca]|uniref:Uncharacterized protein n=1 Tax=Saccharothrix coeruleofusca TaxID=33919 RepID=A0A918AGZ7_9PSEU|nr:hypothetical protein [Saccharothrix coeruleofusca]MBP2340340.1 hypothetical protein [Saccharothrix coeruleofusca]GGP36080.1 hypothetical protein GCM10010185_03880 [Saccharothrix coeruleofusca]